MSVTPPAGNGTIMVTGATDRSAPATCVAHDQHGKQNGKRQSHVIFLPGVSRPWAGLNGVLTDG